MLATSIKNGMKNGLKFCWFLIKIIVPVYFIITILQHTPAMGWLTMAFAPAMGLFNLPGEAALPVITGFFLDEYGVIAAIRAVELTSFHATIVAVIVLPAHSLIVEGAIINKLGQSATFFTIYRLIAAIIAGLAVSLLGVVLGL